MARDADLGGALEAAGDLRKVGQRSADEMLLV
jgi:hypothetical protein